MKLNLTARNTAEERIKEYLEQNVTEILADKINNGTPHTERDGHKLINRKTLDGFMKYATEEARKLATKGAQFACIDDATVFGWAIHYFEEDSIIGTLFNLDGTPHEAPKTTAPKQTPTETAKKPPQKPKADTPKQMSALTENTAQTEKKAVILPIPDTKPTQDYRSLPKTTDKPKKNIDTDQISFFDLF